MKKYMTRRGDGACIEMSSDELRKAIEEGSQDASERGKIAPLSQDDLDQLQDIFTNPCRIVGVKPGNEVVLSDDASTVRLIADHGSGGVGAPLSRMQANIVHERAFANDSIHMGHIDESYKAVKAIVAMEQQETENLLMNTITPVFLYVYAQSGNVL